MNKRKRVAMLKHRQRRARYERKHKALLLQGAPAAQFLSRRPVRPRMVEVPLREALVAAAPAKPAAKVAAAPARRSQRAAAQAERGGHPVAAELQLLVVHGVLHLLGHDHARPADKARMWTAQAAILQALGSPITGPAEG